MRCMYKLIILIVTIFIVSHKLFAQELDINDIKIVDYSYSMYKGDFNTAKKLLLNENNIDELSNEKKYDLSVCFSKLNQIDSSTLLINQILKKGYSKPGLLGDRRLENVVRDNYVNIYDQLYLNFKSVNKNIENLNLAFKLLIYYSEDQSNISDKDIRNYKLLHANHMKFIDSLFKSNLITTNSIGKEAMNIIPIFVMHEEDLEKQKYYLKKLKILANRNEIAWQDVCVIIDKVKIAEGKRQLYGTQWRTNSITYKSEPYPIKNIKNIEKRRSQKKFDFTFEQYSKFFEHQPHL